jgi:pantoate--beta-alanine ligase
VNPTQFNQAEDLKRYPRTLEKDIDLLEAAGCDILFFPEVSEIYPENYQSTHYDLGYLDKILEGKFRPGHFQGVCQVVDILLQIMKPHQLFLGEKDFQQCLVISKMIELKHPETEVKICPTKREPSGLAMSSRNLRLNEEEKIRAAAIYESLTFLKKNLATGPLHDLKSIALQKLTESGFHTEYLEICLSKDLSIIDTWDGKSPVVALLAAFMGEVRLIDNMRLYP